MPDTPELGTHISARQRGQEHVTQARERDGHEHDFSRDNMQNEKNLIGEPLVVGHKARDERCGNDGQKNKIRCRGDIADFR